MALMSNFPKFEKILKSKFFRFFFLQIYHPLMKRKSRDIKFYDSRRDYEQVLVVRHYNPNEIKDILT